MNSPITKTQLSAAIEATKALAEAIRELKDVPAGHLYANLMGVMSLDQFEAIIAILVRGGLVTRDQSQMLHWKG